VKTLIFLASLNLPPSTDFLKPPFTHMDALTLPERSLRQDLSGFYDVTSAILTAVVSPAPPHLRSVPISLANTSTVRIHATAQLLFSPRFFIKSVVKSSLRTTAISPWEAKTIAWAGFAPVRGLQASACFRQRFSALIGRCLGAEPKLHFFFTQIAW
jgi:hypothetical protein